MCVTLFLTNCCASQCRPITDKIREVRFKWYDHNYDENGGRKLHEENYDGRGHWTLQSGTTEEAMGRHDTKNIKSLQMKK